MDAHDFLKFDLFLINSPPRRKTLLRVKENEKTLKGTGNQTPKRSNKGQTSTPVQVDIKEQYTACQKTLLLAVCKCILLAQ